MTPPVIAALAAVACCLLAFDAFCLASLARYQASNLPKWAWASIICLSFPWGGLAYLAFGVALGAAIRHTAGAIALLPAVFYLPLTLLWLPSPWNHRIDRFTLAVAAILITRRAA